MRYDGLSARSVTSSGNRGGSVDLNRFWAFSKWFSGLITPLRLGALAG